jgi:hypothetical protein
MHPADTEWRVGTVVNSAEDWVPWQAVVSVRYGKCVECATVSLSVCVLPCGISQSVRQLPAVCFCIKSAVYPLYRRLGGPQGQSEHV